MSESQRERVASVTVDRAANQLMRGSQIIKLEPRAMQVLGLLLDRRGEVVPRSDVFETVWRAADVGDDTLNRLVFDLRQAFRALDPDLAPIETIRKVGYRLEAEAVAPADAHSPPGRPWPAMAIGALAIALIVGVLAYQQPDAPSIAPVRPLEIQVFSNDLAFETYPAVDRATGEVLFACQLVDAPAIDLCTRAPTGDATRRILRRAGEGVALHGSKLAFQRTEQACEIVVFDRETSRERVLATCRARNDGSLAFSADGRWLYFSDRPADGAPFAIRAIATEGGETVAITRPPVNSVGDLYPAPSPNGQDLAFFRALREPTSSTYITPGIGRVQIAGLVDGRRDESRALAAVTDSPAEITGLTWDGPSLLFFSNAGDAGFELWRATGERLARFGGFAGLPRQPTVLLDGRIVAESWSAEADLWRRSLTNSEAPAERVFSSTRFDFSPAASPDGRLLAWTSSRGGAAAIWIGDIATGEVLATVDLPDGVEAESPRFSPDSRRLVFERRDGGTSALAVHDLVSQDLRVLAELSGDNRVPSWTPDGTGLLHASDRSGDWQVWRLTLEDLSLEQLTAAGGYAAAAYAAEGGGIVFSRRGDSALWRLGTDDSEPERLIDDLPPEFWGNWALRDAEVVFAVNAPDGPRIDSVDLRSRERRQRLELERPLLRESTNLTVAADGTAVYYAERSRLSADLIVFRLDDG
ncbi:MAG: winged helix-turn-helix domain-containing protein [Pseudomonadota bacterium]